ncbi:acyl-CoA dehydrogenase family protein [Acuticoccus sp. 2012]|uniref:3-sulfinopropanoyl-CoA desulfinase n=2 Tax=Acuticoccus mangrovi TaxID=2796142 RepID=A0A934ITQ3_9HYPH|nr:acyl-CoA dehydrogenase family protein [Acuticoccus mangrovi]MBJ3777855.1 acyl-CoA dehydrogenase family protein [Acuticoccus mangrovi]
MPPGATPFATEDDHAMARHIARFAGDVLAPEAARIDRDAAFAGCHWPALGAIGLAGLNLPEAWGGAGASPLALYLAVEEVAAACASTCSMLTAHYLATDAILLGGDDAQRARWLPGAAAGTLLGAFALTEPQAGSNPADMTTRARRHGGDYVLTGTKHFISNAGAANFIIVFAVTDPAAGARGISAFVVPREAPGVRCGPAEPTMGIRGGHIFEVSLDAVVVPERDRLGPEGKGFATAMKVLDNGRVEVCAAATGIARAGLGAARDWMKAREIGGRPIAHFQGLQWMLADMATALEAARLLGLNAARLRAAGARFTREAAHAKLFAAEAVGRIVDAAQQIHGGYGYTAALGVERLVRDARILRIYEGSSEIQRTIIARDLLG